MGSRLVHIDRDWAFDNGLGYIGHVVFNQDSSECESKDWWEDEEDSMTNAVITPKLLLAPTIVISAVIRRQQVADLIRDLKAMAAIIEDSEDLEILDAIEAHLNFAAKDLGLLNEKYKKVASGE